jgi:hypothetical protein
MSVAQIASISATIPMAVTQAARCASHSLIAFLRLIFLINSGARRAMTKSFHTGKLTGQAVWPVDFIMPRNFPRHCDLRHTCWARIGERMCCKRVWFPPPLSSDAREPAGAPTFPGAPAVLLPASAGLSFASGNSPGSIFRFPLQGCPCIHARPADWWRVQESNLPDPKVSSR